MNLSGWAFSATEAIESAWFLAGNKLVELSEQQIVDCDKVHFHALNLLPLGLTFS